MDTVRDVSSDLFAYSKVTISEDVIFRIVDVGISFKFKHLQERL